MKTTVLAYLLIASYFAIERLLRKGDEALSLEAGKCDCGSSKTILVSGLVTILLAFLAPVLNAKQIGFWCLGYGCWGGVALMLVGLSLRYWAAVTLGEFYTRTLKTVDGQQIVDRPPYNIIRHPGYAGLFLMEIGASLAVDNWIIFIALIIGIRARLIRIEAEEKMLMSFLSEEYQTYRDCTWKLIPFVY